MSWLTQLQLNQYRCYDTASLDGLSSGPVVLYGANGAGKTNILEAISLLTPGRGLRKAKLIELQRNETAGQADKCWAVSAIADTKYGDVCMGTGFDPHKDKRIVRINGETVRSQSSLGEYLSCVWLTPQMDRLFIEGSSSRRRFLDRFVFAFDPAHSGRINRYDKALRQRSKLLQENNNPDTTWLGSLEANMAETGVAIAAARLDLVQRLQQVCDRTSREEKLSFPHSSISIEGTVEELLINAPAIEVEEMFKYQLAQTRQRDAVSGGASTGIHRTDIKVYYTDKDMQASQCSTGEQKALLIGLILAHSRLIAADRGHPPILLLDEVSAHLDKNRRESLYELLLDIGGQVWLTGTDISLFTAIKDRAAFFHIDNGIIISASKERAA